MAFRLAEAFVEIGSRDRALRQGFAGTRAFVGNQLRSMRAQVATLALTAGGGLAGAGAIAQAAEAEEIESQFRQVFKTLANEADQFAQDFSDAIGRSVVGTKSQLAAFQDTFVPLGFGREEAAKFSMQLVELTADLASFKNMADNEVMDRLIGGLVGGHENLLKFGVVIKEASLNQELLNMGIEGGSKAANEQQKVLARLNLIMAGTKDAQGDAGRTSEAFTNSVRRLKGEMRDFAAVVGSFVLPALAELAQDLSAVLDRMTTLLERLKESFDTFFLGAELKDALKVWEQNALLAQQLKEGAGQQVAEPVTADEVTTRDGVRFIGFDELARQFQEQQNEPVQIQRQMLAELRDGNRKQEAANVELTDIKSALAALPRSNAPIATR